MTMGICSHDELKWGRRLEICGGEEITVCGRCGEEVAAIYTKPKPAWMPPNVIPLATRTPQADKEEKE